MLSAPNRRCALLLALVGSAISSAAANAQFVWATPGTSGTWNLNTNWNPLGIPNGAGASAALPAGAPYTVSINSNVAANTVSIASGASLALANSVQLTLSNPNAAINNEGTFILNPAGIASAAGLVLQNTATVSLDGAGQMVLNAHPSNLDTAVVSWWNGNERLVNGPSHTIRGTGRVRTFFTNDGTVNADANGSSLWFTDQSKVNNGTMKATGGGVLSISCRFDQDPAAAMRAEANSFVNIGGSVYSGSIGSIGTGLAQFSANSSIGGNTLFGRVDIPSGVSVFVENSNMVNNALFTVNPAGAAAGTSLGLRNGSTVLSGTGTLRLNAESSNLDTAAVIWWNGNERLTNDVGHSIRGTGRIRTLVTNDSLIAADVNGKSLWLSDQVKTNNAIIEATGGGALLFTVQAVQSPSGVIRCDGSSSIFVQGCNISGGTISAAPGATTTYLASAAISNNPTINGASNIRAGSPLYFEGTGMLNSGVFTVNPTGENLGTYLSLRNGPGAFLGSGSIVLNAHPANLDTASITWWSGNEVFTHGAAHTIRGTGRIRTFIVNEGTISADVNAATLWLSDQAKTNNNLIRATGGGQLTFSTNVTQGAAGRIVSENGSLVLFSGGTIAGGQIQSVGTGVVNLQASTHLQTLRNASNMYALPNHTNYIDGNSTITNDGTINVGNIATAGAAYLSAINGPVSFEGSGALVLAGSGGNNDLAHITWWSGNEVVTNGPAHTIRGVGRIRTFLTNNGTISADVPATSIWFSDQAKTNNNIIKAVNNAQILSTCAINQSDTGRIQMFDGSRMTFSGGSLNGGVLESGGSGLYVTQSSAYLQTFTNNARLRMLPGNTTYTSGNNTITNNGLIYIGDSTSGGTGVYAPQNGPVTLAGNGTLILDADPANPELAQISFWAGNEVLTNGANHTIGGTGRILTFLTNNGNLTPGPLGGGIGEIRKTNQRLTFAEGGRLNIEVASATSFDKISGSAPLTLGGDLQVNLINGYTGGIGTTYEIVRGSSITGTFNVLDIPDHPTAGLKYGLQYTSNSVLLRVTCNADFNSDGIIDLFDYLDFVDVFSTGVPDSDYNADGIVDLFDYLDYVDQFASGCD